MRGTPPSRPPVTIVAPTAVQSYTTPTKIVTVRNQRYAKIPRSSLDRGTFPARCPCRFICLLPRELGVWFPLYATEPVAAFHVSGGVGCNMTSLAPGSV